MSKPYVITKDYTGRQVDLEAFSAPDSPVYNVQVVLGMKLDTTPRRLAGIEKLVQRYVNLMLMPIGDVHHDPDNGSLLLRDIRLGGSYTADQLLHSFIFANAQVINQLRSEDANPDYGVSADDEMIASASIVQAWPDYQTGRVHVTIRLMTRSGERATFVVPLGPTDARVPVPALLVAAERTRWVPPVRVPEEPPEGKPFAIRITTVGTPENFIFQTDDAVNLVVQWNGNEEPPETFNGTGLRTHSYATPGTYTITFARGTASRIAFGAGGCTPASIVEVVTPVPVRLGLTSADEMFKDCTGIIAWVPNFFDAASANITNMASTFYGANFNESVSGLKTSKVTTMFQMFSHNDVFNQPIEMLDTSNVAQMSYMLRDAVAFNQPVNGLNTSSLVTTRDMFRGAILFNQDLSGWNVTSLANAVSMLLGSAFSQINYDKLLDITTGWASQSVKDNVPFHAGAAKYGAGNPAAGRAHLVAALPGGHAWVITDGGPA